METALIVSIIISCALNCWGALAWAACHMTDAPITSASTIGAVVGLTATLLSFAFGHHGGWLTVLLISSAYALASTQCAL